MIQMQSLLSGASPQEGQGTRSSRQAHARPALETRPWHSARERRSRARSGVPARLRA